jgi:DHA1 family bicyclomycin/chloramphenicol resistance-like MFS transporter
MKQRNLQTRWGGFLLFAILGVMACLTPMSTDMYLPGFTAIAKDLAVTVPAVQVTLSASFAGIGIGMPFWGPISDRFGRRIPALVGVAIYFSGALLCSVASDLSHLAMSRFIMALGGSGVMVIGRAVVRDLFEGQQMARALGAVSSVLISSSVLSPSLGAVILHYTNWRNLFLVLCALGVLAAVGLAILPESLPPERRKHEGLSGVLSQYRTIFKDRIFRFAVTQQAFNSMILMSYVGCSAAVYMQEFGLSQATFGVIFGANAASMFIATQIHRYLLKTQKVSVLLVRLLTFQFFAAVLLTTVGLVFHTAWMVIACTMLATSILPSITAGSTTIAMTNFSGAAAQASSVIGLIQSVSASSITAVLVLLPVEPLQRMLIGMGFGGVMAMALLILRKRRNAIS